MNELYKSSIQGCYKECLECGLKNLSNKPFADHIKYEHNMTGEQYYVKHALNGKIPKCRICDNNAKFYQMSRGFYHTCGTDCGYKLRELNTEYTEGRKQQFTDWWNDPEWVKTHSELSSIRLSELHNDPEYQRTHTLQASQLFRNINRRNNTADNLYIYCVIINDSVIKVGTTQYEGRINHIVSLGKSLEYSKYLPAIVAMDIEDEYMNLSKDLLYYENDRYTILGNSDNGHAELRYIGALDIFTKLINKYHIEGE